MSSVFRPGLKSLLLAAAITTALPAPVSAGHFNSSEAVVLVSAVVVLSVPLMASYGVAAGSGKVIKGVVTGSRSIAGSGGTRVAAVQLPPLEVRAVATQADGSRRVDLQDPTNAENTAQLHWPSREDDPAAGFVVGEMVDFVPSQEGSGWTVHAPGGQALAYVPTAESARDAHSERW